METSEEFLDGLAQVSASFEGARHAAASARALMMNGSSLNRKAERLIYVEDEIDEALATMRRVAQEGHDLSDLSGLLAISEMGLMECVDSYSALIDGVKRLVSSLMDDVERLGAERDALRQVLSDFDDGFRGR